MVRRRILVSMIVLLITAAGCAGSTEEPRGASPASPPPNTPEVTPSAEPACPSPSLLLEITAKDIEFDTECLAVPADEPFTIRFTNADDGTPHNFAIHSQTLAETFLEGKVIKGVKTITLKANALDPGEYLFQCDLHPLKMNGTLDVGG